MGAAKGLPLSGKCPVCGARFEIENAVHVFCSEECWHEAERKGAGHRMMAAALAKRVPRRFTCARCGKEVFVSEPYDRRTRFCSERCEKLYWKKPHRRAG